MGKRKKLGQNFLVDESITQHIIDIADPGPEDHVLEIGPGLGVLTNHLLVRAGKVTAIEIDPELCPKLGKKFSGRDNFQLIQADAIKFDYNTIEKPFKVVSNLPYYAATHILKRLIGYRNIISDMTVMLQKEVVDRLVAEPGNRDYSFLTVFVQYYCLAERRLEVSKESFSPKPKIDSSVIKLSPLSQPRVQVDDENMFFKIVHAAFMHKRKMLKNNLKAWETRFSEEKDKLMMAGIDLNRRGETLSLQDFASLSNSL